MYQEAKQIADHNAAIGVVSPLTESPLRFQEDIASTTQVTCPSATITCQRCRKPNLAKRDVDLSIESMRESARSGCVRCSTILCGLTQVEHLYEAQEDQDPAEQQITVFFADPTVTIAVLGQYKGTGRRRLFSKSIELCYNIDGGS